MSKYFKRLCAPVFGFPIRHKHFALTYLCYLPENTSDIIIIPMPTTSLCGLGYLQSFTASHGGNPSKVNYKGGIPPPHDTRHHQSVPKCPEDASCRGETRVEVTLHVKGPEVPTARLGIFVVLDKWLIDCHLANYVSTPASKIEQFCVMSESCVHDTIPVCGRMGDEKRTFLDLCDMLEFACDTNLIYAHIDDEEGCPKERPQI